MLPFFFVTLKLYTRALFYVSAANKNAMSPAELCDKDFRCMPYEQWESCCCHLGGK